MLLVHERKGKPGTWEVAWTWMPYFLASDRDLIKYVDEKMTEVLAERKTISRADLHWEVIDLIVQRHPISGLREYLGAATDVYPEGAP